MHVPRFDVGDWCYYDIGLYEYKDLGRITVVMPQHYIVEMIMEHGKRYPGIAVVHEEFDRVAVKITEEQAMLEILQRGKYG